MSNALMGWKYGVCAHTTVIFAISEYVLDMLYASAVY
jgi:hypothetical protein